MADTQWEVLALRGLAMTDETAAEFVGTLLIHRVGSPEPVESISVRVKRAALEEIAETLRRTLARSTRFAR